MVVQTLMIRVWKIISMVGLKLYFPNQEPYGVTSRIEVAACSTLKGRGTNDDVIGYIKDHCTYDDMSWDLNGGGGSDMTPTR